MNIITSTQSFLRTLFSQRDLILSLAKREIHSQYQGSILGFFWTVINPLIMVVVFWFVFSVGFKSQPMNDVPFVVWLTAGLAVWMLFAEIVSGSSEIVIQNSQLIKKTLFKPQILPLVKILSALVTHSVFVLILIGLILSQGLPWSWFYLQALYYTLCACVLALGIAWCASALTVFVRDVSKIVAVILQIGFWATPIFWHLDLFRGTLVFGSLPLEDILTLNPMYYVVEGYRDSFITFVPFWEHGFETIRFWVVASLVLFFGALVFHRLKPHFADVL